MDALMTLGPLGTEWAEVMEGTELEVIDSVTYEQAGTVLKRIKKVQKKVEEFFEPDRKATYDAYKAVTDRKAAFIDPLKHLEKLLKGRVSDYLYIEEKKRQAREAEIRRQAVLEAEAKLEEARQAELNGDDELADKIYADAEVMKMVSETAVVEKKPEKAEGVSARKSWEIIAIDPAAVPVSVNGKEIRPVDKAAVMQLIKESKGTVEIPGIQYRETAVISVRA